MIYTLRGKNVFSVVNTLTNITSLAEVFNRKPDKLSIPEWSYLYINIVSDNPRVYSNKWNLMKTARISFTIVCKKTLWSWENEESVLYDIIDKTTNSICNEWCSKISQRDWFIVNSISENSISPIFTNEMNRAYIVKDYLFNYLSYQQDD